jgi:hypothetical protein
METRKIFPSTDRNIQRLHISLAKMNLAIRGISANLGDVGGEYILSKINTRI